MSLEYIRDHYGVPAEVDAVIDFEWPAGRVRTGTIVGAQGAYLLALFGDPLCGPVPLHPTWNVTYREAGGVSGSSHE